MAIHYAVRWRPQAYRSTQETILMGRHGADPDADPPVTASAGQRVQVLQLVIFDDTELGTAANPYRPGAPATEQCLAIADEVPIMLAISAFAGKDAAASTALWDAARDAQIAAWTAQPDIVAVINAAVGGYQSAYVVVV